MPAKGYCISLIRIRSIVIKAAIVVVAWPFRAVYHFYQAQNGEGKG